MHLMRCAEAVQARLLEHSADVGGIGVDRAGLPCLGDAHCQNATVIKSLTSHWIMAAQITGDGIKPSPAPGLHKVDGSLDFGE
jgi:hypothetical protein